MDKKAIEYSSYFGQSAVDKPQKLKEEYQIRGSVPEVHHFKCCVFDAIKGYSDLPQTYMYGVVAINEKNGRFTFYDPKTHLIYLGDEANKTHDTMVEQKLKALRERYNTSNIEELIVCAYKQEEAWRDEELVFDV
jgi:hypothetical protein